MSLRGDGKTTCYDCGFLIDPGYSGSPGCCKRCDGVNECASCGSDYGPNEAGENGRCVMCELCEAGGAA